MSYTLTDLYASIKLISKRSALANATILEMIRKAEATMNTDLRPLPTSTTLTESDRDSGAVYNLPSDCAEIRSIARTYNSENVPVTLVGLTELESYSVGNDPFWVAQISETQIEFRGTPDTDTSFPLYYWARVTELSSGGDSNAILLNYRNLYQDGTLAALYEHLEDWDQAERYAAKFANRIESLNAHYSRNRKGKTAPGHNLGQYRAGSSM